MRRFFLLIMTAIALFSCAPPIKKSSPPPSTGMKMITCPHVEIYSFKDENILNDSLKHTRDDCSVNPQLMEEIENWVKTMEGNDKLSLKYNADILKAKQLYDNGRYNEATKLLIPVVKDEPYNLFALEALGKTLYWTNDREGSFQAYKKLICILETRYRKSDVEGGEKIISLDMWFFEAYWKYGTLLLDRKCWDLAAFNISKFLMAAETIKDNQQPLMLFEQVLGYLTEAFFHMNKFEIAKYYAQETLKLNPENQYVKTYLDQMK